jgi:glycosyltransferase involved in cell wall biosynthesis
MELKPTVVSVIIPAYQAATTLARALDSVLQQDYPWLEVVIVDDGSTDATRRVAEQFAARDQRVKYHRQANQGPASARNMAVAISSGEYLAFLDDDDEWRPGKLQYQVDVLAHPEAIDLVFTDSLNVNVAKRRSRKFSEIYAQTLQTLGQKPLDNFRDVVVFRPGLRPALYRQNFIHLSSVMMRRTTFDRLGGFDPALRVASDIDLWVRGARSAKFAYCSQMLAVYYYGPTSLSWYSEKALQDLIKYHQMCRVAPEYTDLRDQARIHLRNRYRYLIIYYGRHWNPLRALATFRRSLEIGLDWTMAVCVLIALLGPLPSGAANRFVWTS